VTASASTIRKTLRCTAEGAITRRKYKGKEAQGVSEWEKQNPAIVKKLTG
jgi:hypothetical protein